MKRRTLDLLFSAGGVLLAGLLLVLGMVMTSNANFSKNYVADQLAQQHITFKTAATLTDEENLAPCLNKYAGLPLTTGKQAECYANSFIGLHVKTATGGLTYADLGVPQSALNAQIAAAKAANPTDPAIADLQTQLTKVTGQRETAFKGETLRGLLLTSYGFSVFGTKGGEVATVAYMASGLLLLLSIAGFAHAMRTEEQDVRSARLHAYRQATRQLNPTPAGERKEADPSGVRLLRARRAVVNGRRVVAARRVAQGSNGGGTDRSLRRSPCPPSHPKTARPFR
jgi:hypothetical protein